MPPHDGKVSLVGAGPGAADLLTLRALRAIEVADIVLYDALVGDEVLALIPPQTKRVAVGKRGHRPSTPQDFINRLMARYAKRGAKVVRLKGGDPSMFGRAGEERAFLETQGVAVEVIAGVTTASAAAAQFGFSLTERGVARRVLFATGRTFSGAQSEWRSALDADTTLCLYMGCADSALIAARLIEGGRDGGTPVLIAANVERADASHCLMRLADLATQPPRALEGPVLIVIGECCASVRSAITNASASAIPPGVLGPERRANSRRD